MLILKPLVDAKLCTKGVAGALASLMDWLAFPAGTRRIREVPESAM